MGTSRVIKGPKAGAGELGCGDPGTAAMKVKPRMSGLPFEGGDNNYSPKKIVMANKSKM